MHVVAKIGSSSLTDGSGRLNTVAMAHMAAEVSALRRDGHRVVLVSSGAVAAGMPRLGIEMDERPTDPVTLQAIAAVGQVDLMATWNLSLGAHDLVGGQVLLAPYDFMVRDQYLHARATLARLLELGVVPVVNENDTVADDEIRFGDNDRIAALVATLVEAELLVLCTDTAGLFTSDPRWDSAASLIEEVTEVDAQLEAVAGGAGTSRGSGGMASKVGAAKMAAWSGVRTVIAAADAERVLQRAVSGDRSVGTTIQPRARRLTSRKLWIAFALAPAGRVMIDAGATSALVQGGRSLLAAGVTGHSGRWNRGDGVEVLDPHGTVVAKGIAGAASDEVVQVAGRRSSDLPDDLPHEIIHRDDLVVLA